ncbi:DUF3885 domain-containing protein [Epilithonimonas vandammei]|uniref:DUF3885 domain-containing protein n=1 Tax=Epilithonimonas vandammei TaxID=2487072 RepID=UPI0028AB9A09|nr:hypothetical protein [Epilithonimonas vandammei]
MTKEDFQNLWTLNYPDTVPISHLFKHDYSDRWFRIHSLPESKRYADNENEWEILLARQNEIISDLFGLETPIVIVTGEYNWGDNRQIHVTDEEEIFKPFSFVRLDNIELNKIDAEQYDEPDIYRPAFAQTIWKSNYHDNLLREIANDNTRAFFVSFDKNIIVAPYDGGVDFILKDNQTRDSYKEKYKQWLSEREDGL